MRNSMNYSGSVSPVRNTPLYGSTATSSVLPTSARPSRHLHSSLLHTPTHRSSHSSMTAPSGESNAPVLLSLLDTHASSMSGRFGEWRNNSGSGRYTVGNRSDEETSSVVDLEQVTAEAEAAALTRSRAELCDTITDLRTRARMLRSTILCEREDVAMLQEGMKETYEAAEKEGESITNQLMRRVAIVRRQKMQLEARLRREEVLKAEQAQKLMDLKTSSLNLERRLKREEEVTLASMNEQLMNLQTQRQHLENYLSENSSVQQLQEFVDYLQAQSTGCSGNLHHSSRRASLTSYAGSPHTPKPGGAESMAQSTTDAVPRHLRVDSGDQQEILQYLRREVAVVEAIQREAREQGERYIEKRNELERRIKEAECRQESRDSPFTL
uniref:Uncharacterized protein n=1 Tax=Trypanosoma congolense (strain IL3000) TaxID=1068625 RepID=G0URY7_TRYCI|nr:conserved hypothetical protein [Trypanosoma congolense IL3000]